MEREGQEIARHLEGRKQAIFLTKIGVHILIILFEARKVTMMADLFIHEKFKVDKP